jgi:nucleotide-binding universal stress UspA family protein
MTRRYVVAVDDSRASQLAWEWARMRADAEGVECVAVTIVGGDDRAHASGSLSLHEVPHPAVRLRGEVPEALAAFVEPDDVLVIGTGKTGFAHGRVFGFTGLRVVALAACTVVVIPEVDLRFRSGVVLGVDRIETAAASAAIAATEAARRGETVQVISPIPRGADERRPQDADDAAKIAEHVIRAGWPQLSVRMRARIGSTAAALLDAAQGASLLVIDAGPASADRANGVPGDVALGVLFNANAPILVARTHVENPHPSHVG